MEEARGEKTVSQWRRWAKNWLSAHGDADAGWDADWMLCRLLSCDRSALRLRGEETLDPESAKPLIRWLDSRAAGEPLQYILGSVGFMGLDILCDPRALIPRQDTETLVEQGLLRMKGRTGVRVLDLCCGTGAIGLAVKHHRSDISVSLADVSKDALALARENARSLNLSVAFYQGDLWDAVRGERFDFILSNPPYLTDADMNELQVEVKREPELALRGGEDGLSFYRRIAERLNSFLLPGGEALLEVGQGQDQSVRALLQAQGFQTDAYKDLGGVTRVVRAGRE